MPISLADRFMEAQGGPIELNGRLVHTMYELPLIAEPTTVHVRLAANAQAPQGLHVKARDGEIHVNNQVLDNIILWTDTAPGDVSLDLRPANGKTMTVRMWNVWRDDAGTVHAWLGES